MRTFHLQVSSFLDWNILARQMIHLHKFLYHSLPCILTYLIYLAHSAPSATNHWQREHLAPITTANEPPFLVVLTILPSYSIPYETLQGFSIVLTVGQCIKIQTNYRYVALYQSASLPNVKILRLTAKGAPYQLEQPVLPNWKLCQHLLWLWPHPPESNLVIQEYSPRKELRKTCSANWWLPKVYIYLAFRLISLLGHAQQHHAIIPP